MTDHSWYYNRIRDLADEARHEYESFDPPAEDDLPADDRAMTVLRFGVGEVVSLYIEARTADWDVEFSGEELSLLHEALNRWFELYARCYGVEMDPDFTIRETAEMVLKTHNIKDTAQMMTRVPER